MEGQGRPILAHEPTLTSANSCTNTAQQLHSLVRAHTLTKTAARTVDATHEMPGLPKVGGGRKEGFLLDDGVLVQLVAGGDALALVLGGASEREGFGALEVDRGADLLEGSEWEVWMGTGYRIRPRTKQRVSAHC